MPESQGLVRNALGERDGHQGGTEETVVAQTGSTIYSNLLCQRAS